MTDPERYGVVEFDATGRTIRLVEKPVNPKSRHAIPGLYFYDNRVVEILKNLAPSPRGELEITDVNRWYLDAEELCVEPMGRRFAWLDTGTHDSVSQASSFVEAVEQRQGLKICCPEEIAYRLGYIPANQLTRQAAGIKSGYGVYLRQLVES